MPPAFTTMRHAAHDAVALVADGEKAAPGGGVFQHRHVAQKAGERHEECARIGPARRDAGLRRRRIRRASSAECRIGRGSRAIVLIALASTSSLLGRLRSFALVSSSTLRKRSDREMAATAGPAPRNSTSKAIATAPRPFSRSIRSATSVRGHGHCPSARRLVLVDIDDDDRLDGRNARFEDLIEVEAAQPQVFDRRRIPDPQRDQARRASQARPSAARRRNARSASASCLSIARTVRRAFEAVPRRAGETAMSDHFSRNARES